MQESRLLSLPTGMLSVSVAAQRRDLFSTEMEAESAGQTAWLPLPVRLSKNSSWNLALFDSEERKFPGLGCLIGTLGF